MNNNELNNQNNVDNQATGVFNNLNSEPVSNNKLNNSALDDQLFTDTSLNNFGQTLNTNQTPVNSGLTNNLNQAPINNGVQQGMDLAGQSLQSENVNTIFDNTASINTQTPVNNIEETPKATEPVKEEPKVETKEKKSKGPVALIVLLIIVILGLAGYIVYDKFLSKDTKEPETKEEETALKEVKDKALIEELRSELVTKDNSNSLYYDQKMIATASDKKLIYFNIMKYVDENNLKFNENGANYGEGAKLLLTVPKDDISLYMTNKYNTNIRYKYTSTSPTDYLDNSWPKVVADENNYNIITINTGHGTNVHKTKLIKAEEDNDNVYLYDKYVLCSSEAGWMGCVSSRNDALGVESMVSCTEGTTSEKCPAQVTWNNLPDYVLNNMSDKLKTFKHTFKKIDGNYFWVSSEVVE